MSTSACQIRSLKDGQDAQCQAIGDEGNSELRCNGAQRGGTCALLEDGGEQLQRTGDGDLHLLYQLPPALRPYCRPIAARLLLPTHAILLSTLPQSNPQSYRSWAGRAAGNGD